MDHWQKHETLYDRLQQQYNSDIETLRQEAKLNNMPNNIFQARLDMIRRGFDQDIKYMNRPLDRDNHKL